MNKTQKAALRVSWWLRKINKNWRLISKEVKALSIYPTFQWVEVEFYEHVPTGHVMQNTTYRDGSIF